jgi:hypothetical protein
MATDDRSDFDLASLLQAPATAMAGFMGLADGARKAVTGVLDTIASLQRAAAAMEKLTARMTALLDDIEGPVRSLTPEFERAMVRVQRVADAFEGPVDRLLPGLENAVETFDRLALSQLPENMDQLRDQVTTVIEAFSEFPRRMAGLAQFVPGLERLAVFRPIAQTDAKPVTGASSVSAQAGPKSAAAAKPSARKSPAQKVGAVKKTAVNKTVVNKAVVKKAAVKRTADKKTAARTKAVPTRRSAKR